MRYQLGDIVFTGAYGPASLSSQHAARYSALPLVNEATQLQKTGDELVSFTFAVNLHFSFADVAGSIASFETARAAGSILPLTDGTGHFYGTYVVASYNVTRTLANNRGVTVGATLGVNLTQYIDPDPESTARRENRAKASALSENGATASIVAALPPTDAGVVVFSLSAASDAAFFADDRIDVATDSPSQRAAILTQVGDTYDTAKGNAEQALQTLTDVQTLAAQAEGLVEATEAVIAALSLAAEAARAGDLSNAKSQSLNVLSAVDQTTALSRGLSTNIIARRQ